MTVLGWLLSHKLLLILSLICVAFGVATIVLAVNNSQLRTEIEAGRFLDDLNKRTAENSNRLSLASWAYASNLTEENLNYQLVVAAEVANETKELWQKVIQFDWEKFSDYSIRRQFKAYSVLGFAALAEDKYTRRNKIIGDMQSIYSTAKICPRNVTDNTSCTLALEPELTEILATSRDEEELKHVWLEWRNAVGPKCKDLYTEYVDLSNEGARLNNFEDNTEYWLSNYEDSSFREQVQALWEQLRPLYLQIHAYVRFKLRQQYGDVVSERGPIPVHLLGNMWAQSWANIASFTRPYPNATSEDLTEELQKQNYTAIKIFETAEEFFKSINLSEMPASFWEKSILVKPNNTELTCHASAWDFQDQQDFRIKQCTEITQDHFITAHHEMGHIEYYIQYKDQPIQFRTGANDGFHEAVGDLISLSVRTPKHLKQIGLKSNDEESQESVLNYLYEVGLSKIVFLPFGYLMDLWRWDVFSGTTTSDAYNCKWWELREQYQGVEPPVNRSEADFDPAAKYHIVADVPYLRYFISYVMQFQFHRALCEKAGEYDPNNSSTPLHECDIYQNAEAGNLLKEMLAMGASRPWPDAMEVITGQRTMDASGLLEYFEPLQTYLEEENEKNGVFIGWENSTKVCVK